MSATLVVVTPPEIKPIADDIEQIEAEIGQLEVEAEELQAEADALRADPNYVLTLDGATARALYHVLRHVGGHAGNTRRGHADQIYTALARVFGAVFNADANDILGSVWFAPTKTL